MGFDIVIISTSSLLEDGKLLDSSVYCGKYIFSEEKFYIGIELMGCEGALAQLVNN